MSEMIKNPDLLEMIFGYLDPTSVKTASAVSRTWNSVIEKPKFWRWTTLRLDRGNYREIIQSLQNENDQSRVSNVQKICVSLQEEEDNSWVLNILQDLVTAVQDEDSHLKSLDIAGRGASSVDWTSLPVELLAQVLVSLDKGSLDLIGTGPTFRLNVGTFLCNCWRIYRLSQDHVNNLFQMIAKSSVMNMNLLYLSSKFQIAHIPPKLFSHVVTKLEIIWAGGVLTAGQISAVFNRLSVVKDQKLKNLDLAYNDLSSVPTEILVGGISGLEHVKLMGTKLTTEQLTGIFTRLSVLEDHKLKTLNLRHNSLSLVPTDILVAGISGLEYATLCGTRLTTEQLSGIYRMVADRRCSRLREIKISRYHPSSISQDIQDRAKLNESVKITVW